ncbi:autocrine proliferation repressor protein A-like [Ahaetulla prasina]|uniref:autocrine proliferation repressor protein A-like n=1 Tax=Ahaetulla prasina TaxID=499056 RepID=UPI002647DB48|nr:autocrine proliferation repressor protein A-like [Ahaetulla prasina]
MNLLFYLFFFIHAPPVYPTDQKALEDYVNLPDPHYSYTLVSKEEHHDSTVYTINMTSLKWLDDSEVDKTIWWHMMTIAVPKVYKNAQMKKSCFLLLAGGRNGDPEEPAEYSADQIKTLAVTTGSYYFQKHPFGMKNITENSLFAYVLWRFINDPTTSLDWVIQFPMVKATVRALDTVTDFLLKQTCEDVQITEFMLLGSSKRGWIAWLTAAIDKRVVSFVSVVMDVLNFVENLHHQYRSYCGWSFALAPFYHINITQQIDHPRFELIASNIDPLKYNEHYINKAKYLLVASGDEMGQPDNSYYYFNQLTGEKYLRIIPNTNHALAFYEDNIGVPTATFYLITMQNQQHPQVHWNRTVKNTGGAIYFSTDQEPSLIYAYYANTNDDTRRDFRMHVLSGQEAKRNPIKWNRAKVKKVSTNVYKKEIKNPDKGWTGFFIEATYSGFEDSSEKLVITSELHIIPETFPCEDCVGEECYSKLV